MSSHTAIKGADLNRANRELARITSKSYPFTVGARKALEAAGWKERGPDNALMPPWMGPNNWVDIDIKDIFLNGSSMRDNLREGIIDGRVEWTLEGASTVELVIQDRKRELVQSGIGAVRSTINIDGIKFALVKTAKRENTFTLTFEDDIINKLRQHGTRPGEKKRWQRGIYSRAQVISELVLEAIKDIPEPHNHLVIPAVTTAKVPKVKTPKEPLPEEPPSTKAERRSYGIPPKQALKVKGAEMSSQQRGVCEEVLQAGVSLGADKKCLVAAIMCIIQESDAGTASNNDPTTEGVGAFSQIKSDGWPATGNANTDAKAFFKKLIRNDVTFKYKTYGELINSVQGSANAELYNPWKKEADEIVTAFGRGQSFGSLSKQETVRVDKAYFFERKEEEDSWTCIQRLAAEVQWRAFVFRGVFFYVSENELIQAGPVFSISEDDDAVDWIDYEKDTGEAYQTAKIICRENFWTTPPGSIIEITDPGDTEGRWLVYDVIRSMFSKTTEVTINAPIKELEEPAPPTETIKRPKGKSSLELVAEMAEKALGEKGSYRYQEIRPMPSSLFGPKPRVMDCSAFATLCYKAAGFPDPNGKNYDGSGFTGTLIAHCEKVAHPDPGDLCFFGTSEQATSHVNVYVGGGKSVSMGTEGDPSIGPAKAMGPGENLFLGYYRVKGDWES